MKKKYALSVAGSDPIGGAGIQADLKTFSSLDLHGLTVITCVTAQNSKKVKEIYRLPVDIIENQFECSIDGKNLEFIKVGMLYDKEVSKLIVNKIKKYHLRSIVDPIMYASSGDSLSNPDIVDTLKIEVIPNSFIVTPNIYEAQVLSENKIKKLNDVKEACKIISNMGAKYVLITGGHLNDKFSQDILFDGKEYYTFSLPKIQNKKFHGTGCVLSSLIAGLLILGNNPVNSVEKAKNILWNMMDSAYNFNKEYGNINNSTRILNDSLNSFSTYDQFKTWFDLNKIINSFISKIPLNFIPEVGINIGYALKNAKNQKDICAIDGRIIKTSEGPKRCGYFRFGASKHISSIILAAMNFNSKYRCAMNFKFSINSLKNCEKKGLLIDSFKRENEPSDISSTMEWGTQHIISKINKIPDIIYDLGGNGKEPMIRLLAENPNNLYEKFLLIINDN